MNNGNKAAILRSATSLD